MFTIYQSPLFKFKKKKKRKGKDKSLLNKKKAECGEYKAL